MFISLISIWLISSISFVFSDIIVRDLHRQFPSYVRIKSVESSFGQDLPSSGLIGFLLRGDPLDGCSHVQKAPTRCSHDPHWFILFKRSPKCSFSQKVLAATKGNYSGAIIFNDRSDRIFGMEGDPNLDSIPAVFIGVTDGEKLLRDYVHQEDLHTYLAIYPDETLHWSIYILLASMPFGICFLLFLMKFLYNHLQRVSSCLPRRALKKLPIIRFNPERDAYDACCICLEDFKTNDRLRVLPCHHAYHTGCIDPWLLNKRGICPQCRTKVFNNGHGEDEDSDTGDMSFIGPSPIVTIANSEAGLLSQLFLRTSHVWSLGNNLRNWRSTDRNASTSQLINGQQNTRSD
uniref:RING-type E3 ubiquitin transferase n=1 Tax=Caligus rogercresseyi TaxID=217165 RepID=C1BR48_CALRO|nr:RING finger protein 13 [Caligus rogercresseyi]